MEDYYPGGDDILFDFVSIPSELYLFFDYDPLEEPLNWLDLESLSNNTHYIDCVFNYSYVPS